MKLLSQIIEFYLPGAGVAEVTTALESTIVMMHQRAKKVISNRTNQRTGQQPPSYNN